MSYDRLFPRYIQINKRSRAKIFKCEFTKRWYAELEYKYLCRDWFGLGKLGPVWKDAGYSNVEIEAKTEVCLKATIAELKNKSKNRKARRKKLLEFADTCNKLDNS